MQLVDFAEKITKYLAKQNYRYIDVRAEKLIKNSLIMEDGNIENVSVEEDLGLGIRILEDNHWSFLSISNPENFEVIRERISSRVKIPNKSKLGLTDYPIFNETIKLETKKEPTLEELEKIAYQCHAIISEKRNIIKDTIHSQFNKITKFFINSSGTRIQQDYYDTFSEISITSRDSGVSQSVNITEGGRGGLEMLSDNEKIFVSTKNMTEKVSQLVYAKSIKNEKTTVIMNPDFVSLLTHEILGHPSEGDRVLGREMAWAGGSWWAGKLGNRIGSEKLTVFDNPTIKGTLGSYEFDDEGVKSSKTTLIENGILKNHFQSRETASEFDVTPTGNMRATSYRFMPLIRMACTCIDNGDWLQEEMIKETNNGYLICNMKIPSIDMKRYNWSISSQFAYRIEHGEVKELVRDVIVMGNSPEFFNSIDACGTDFEIRPILNCGKGDPMQIMMMGNGGPSIRGIASVRST